MQNSMHNSIIHMHAYKFVEITNHIQSVGHSLVLESVVLENYKQIAFEALLIT